MVEIKIKIFLHISLLRIDLHSKTLIVKIK